MKTTNLIEERKTDIVHAILRNQTYLSESGMYKLAEEALSKLSYEALDAIETIIMAKEHSS